MRNIIRNGIVGHHIINKSDRGKEVTGKILPAILTEQVRDRKLYGVWWSSVKIDSFYGRSVGYIRAEKNRAWVICKEGQEIRSDQSHCV